MDSSCSDYLKNIKYIHELKLHYKQLSINNKIKNLIKCKYKIYDCFTYFNEINLLLFRIEYTYNYVEKIIIIEADETHRGDIKNTKLDLNLIPKKYHNKIIYKYISFSKEELKKVDTGNHPDDWKREYYQRNIIKDILLTFNHNDMCIISDCDEIPNYETLIRYLNKYNLYDEVIHYISPTYLYNIHNLQYNYHASCSFSCKIKQIKDNTLSKIRFKSKRNLGTKIKWTNKDKIWISEKIVAPPCFSLLIPELFTHNKLPCFIHYNRFYEPFNLYLKEHAIVESSGPINYNLELEYKINILKKILFPREDKFLSSVLYQKYIKTPNVPNLIYNYFNVINFLDKETTHILWNIINKDLNYFYKILFAEPNIYLK